MSISGLIRNAFVQRLVEETGIAHVWGTCADQSSRGWPLLHLYVSGFEGQVPNPEREAKRYARELAWNIWKRFAPSLDEVLLHSDKESGAHLVATFFADFLMDNMDLISQVEASFRDEGGGGGMGLLGELERRAERFPQ